MKRRGAAPLLLLDAGNSRVKWALLLKVSDAEASPSSATVRFTRRGVLQLSGLRRSDAPLRRLLAGLTEGTQIWACNVAGASLAARLRVAAARAGLPAPHFLRTTARAAGVRNGYTEPWRLGVDRWVALIGARAAWPRQALCLVGIGSALTIDLLAPSGRHLGGCIAPGPQMMIESLLRETAGIRRRAQMGGAAAIARALADSARPDSRARGRGAPSSLFAKATRGALLAGARYTCAALIEHAAQQASAQLGTRVQIVLSGGAADAIAPLLRIDFRRDDDLVLRGLAVAAAAARAARAIA